MKFASSAKLIQIRPTVNVEAPATPDGKLLMELASIKKEMAALQVKYRELEIESSQRASLDNETDLPLVQNECHSSMPVWYYAVAIILCALGMNNALLMALILLMLSQYFSSTDWSRLLQGKFALLSTRY